MASPTWNLEDVGGSSSSSARHLHGTTWGLLLVSFAAVCFTAATYSLVVKFNLPGAPTTFSEVMDSAAASDHSYYYSILVPMTLPACVIFVFLNWVSVMFFKNA